LFGILPTSLLIFLISAQSINSFRPLGIVGFVLSTYGIIIPFCIIVSHQKLRKFAINFILRNL
jgi:hypothetical protein